MFSLALYGFGFAVLLILMTQYWVYKWRNPKVINKLPPGSMGFPLIGETLQFFAKSPSLDVHPFFKSRIKRYGPLFRTNLLGVGMVVSTEPDFSHFVLQQEGNSVEITQFESFLKLLKQQEQQDNSFGQIHKFLKTSVSEYFVPQEKQREQLVSESEEMARKYLAIWATQESVDFKDATSAMLFHVATKKLFSCDPEKLPESLRDKFSSIQEGAISFALNIPGTAFYKCLKDKRRAVEIIKESIKVRLNSSDDLVHGDFLDFLVENMKTDKPIFNLDSAGDFIFALLFASFEGLSNTATLAVKLLSENTSALKQLTAEHEAIVRSKEDPNSPLTWKEYKQMTFTSQVINETLRIGNISPLILRKVLRDIHINGYTIPAGWRIMIYPTSIQLNPAKFQDPLAFNPWRWNKGQGLSTASKDFIPFGGGMRSCIGGEFTKLQVSLLLHFLVTKYRWTKIRGGEVIRKPMLVFPNGLHVKISQKHLKKQSSEITENKYYN